jgi:hypothetical protein
MRGEKVTEISQYDSCIQTRNIWCSTPLKCGSASPPYLLVAVRNVCTKHAGYETSHESNVVCRRKLKAGHFEALFLDLSGIAAEK